MSKRTSCSLQKKQADILSRYLKKNKIKALRNGGVDLNQSYILQNSDSLTDLFLQEIKSHTADTRNALQPLGPDSADKGW